MHTAPTLETARLRLRSIRAEDSDAQAAMYADPDVMGPLGAQPIGREDSWRRLLAMPGLWQFLGYGYWALQLRDDDRFIGQVGFADFHRDMTPSIEGLPEIGWMLAREAHGHGYATEAARAALAWADQTLAAAEIVAIIAPGNEPSINVARKIGFHETGCAPYKGADTLIFRR